MIICTTCGFHNDDGAEFCGQCGEFLEFSDAIGAGKVQSGHTIVLMRGAGVMLGK